MYVLIRAFRAVDDPKTNDAYVEGHQAVLAAHSIKNLDSADSKWTRNPGVFAIVAEHLPSGKLV